MPISFPLPSSQSLSGRFLDHLYVNQKFNLSIRDQDLWPAVTLLAMRTIAAVKLLFCAAVDLVWWLGMTCTIGIPIQMGKAHFVNFFSIMTVAFSALGIPFGASLPKVDHFRRFHPCGFSMGNEIMELKNVSSADAVQEIIEGISDGRDSLKEDLDGIEDLIEGSNISDLEKLDHTALSFFVFSTNLGVVCHRRSYIEAFLQLQKPLNLNFKDRHETPLLTDVLMGGRISELYNRPDFSGKGMTFAFINDFPLAKLLISNGAVLGEGFEGYLDVLRDIQESMNGSPDYNWLQLRTKLRESSNSYVEVIKRVTPFYTQEPESFNNDLHRAMYKNHIVPQFKSYAEGLIQVSGELRASREAYLTKQQKKFRFWLAKITDSKKESLTSWEQNHLMNLSNTLASQVSKLM